MYSLRKISKKMAVGWVNNHSVLARVVDVKHRSYEIVSGEYYCGLVMTAQMAEFLVSFIQSHINEHEYSRDDVRVEQLELVCDAISSISSRDGFLLRLFNRLNKKRLLKAVHSSFVFRFSDYYAYGYMNKKPVLSSVAAAEHYSFFPKKRFDFFYMLVMPPLVAASISASLNSFLNDCGYSPEHKNYKFDQLKFLSDAALCSFCWEAGGEAGLELDVSGERAVLERPKL